MLGPVFGRETQVAPKRPKHFFARGLYVLALFLLLSTGWLVLAGTRPLAAVGDRARLGGLMFAVLAPLQLTILGFQAALTAASSVAQEKDRRTLILLLLTRISAPELVLGKMTAGALTVLAMLAAGIPVFLVLVLLGGVSIGQVVSSTVIALTTVLASAAIGATLGLWREKTFQALAATVLALVLWVALGEVIAGGVLPGIPPKIASMVSPLRAILSVARGDAGRVEGTGYLIYPWIALAITSVVAGIGMWGLRIWNPSREARQTAAAADDPLADERAVSWKIRDPRPVWDNPVLWREIRTWAYGRKVVLIRAAYVLLFLLAAAGVWQVIASGAIRERAGIDGLRAVPAATGAIAPLAIVSLMIINALAVNSVTNERDSLALDLLLVTDLSAREFIFGKLWGVLYVGKEMLLLPLLLLFTLWWFNGLSGESLIYMLLGGGVLYIFAAALGIHCGLVYSNSRTAVLTSLGTLFFLAIGVITCMVIMVGFRGSFSLQLAPFLAVILGGGAGLLAAMGGRAPSAAVGLSAFLLPLLTFYAITTFLLQRDQLPVLLTVAAGYGFAVAAMLVPALSDLELAVQRGRGEGEG
jgi:ABC-type transport system involved in multi-copper enzyme maturation permease subunit